MNAKELLEKIIINNTPLENWGKNLYSALILSNDVYCTEFAIDIPDGHHQSTALNNVLGGIVSILPSLFQPIRVIRNDPDNYKIGFSEDEYGNFIFFDFSYTGTHQIRIGLVTNLPIIISDLTSALIK